MKIGSPEFKHEEFIPARFTCDGEDINPPLVFENLPQDTQSLALIVDDPDAPMRTWVHWVVYDIPVKDGIKENSVPGKQGTNDFKRRDMADRVRRSVPIDIFLNYMRWTPNWILMKALKKGIWKGPWKGISWNKPYSSDNTRRHDSCFRETFMKKI